MNIQLASNETLNIVNAAGTSTAAVVTSDDSRLTNARTPTAHKNTHATNGSDALTPADIGAATSSHTHSYLSNGTYTVGLPSLSANKTLALSDHTHTDKADKVTSATDGNLAKLNGNGNLADASIAASDVVVKSSAQTLTGSKTFQNCTVYVTNTSSENNSALSNTALSIRRPNNGSAVTDRKRTDWGFNGISTYDGNGDKLYDVWLPGAGGNLTTTQAVNTAISTINTNFTNIQTHLTRKEESNISVGSRASGWTFSPEGSTWNNKLRFFHWGYIYFITGVAKCSSALNANSYYSGIGTFSLPSGYTIIGACAGIPGGSYWIWSSAGGVMGVKTLSAAAANNEFAVRLMMYADTVGNKYTKTTVANL